MTAVLVVVAEVQAHEPYEMPFAEDNDVLEKLSAAVPDPAFSGSVLPRTAIGGTGFVRMALMNSTTAGLNIESRSNTKYRGAVS